MAVVALHTIHVRWRGARRLWPKLARVGISVGIASALTFAYGRIDQILVYELAPHSAEVGLYAAMYKILDNAGFVPIAVMTTLFPIMAGLFPSQPARLHRLMQTAIDYLTMISLGALALMIVAAGTDRRRCSSAPTTPLAPRSCRSSSPPSCRSASATSRATW